MPLNFNARTPETMLILDMEEFELIKINSTEKNQMAFAVILKYFQANGRYPTKKDTIKPLILKSLASQLMTNSTLFQPIHLENRTAKRFRQKIRDFLGYRMATLSDANALIVWLIEQAENGPHTMPQYREKAYQFLREHKIEPFAPKQVDRHIRSATAQFEKQFFEKISTQLSPNTIKLFNHILHDDPDSDDNSTEPNINTKVTLRRLKSDVAGVKLKHVAFEVIKLTTIRSVPIPIQLFGKASRKLLQKYYQRIMAASPSNILEFIPNARIASMACFFHIRSQLLTDSAADLLIKLIHNMKTSAESYIGNKIISNVKRVNGKFDILCVLATIAIHHPQGIIENEIYPKVSQETLQNIVTEMKHSGNSWYQSQVNTKIRSLYSHAHRRALLKLLDAFNFQANTTEGRNFLEAITFIKQHQDLSDTYYPDAKIIPITDIIPVSWRSMVIETEPLSLDTKDPEEKKSSNKINRLNYEVVVLELLREKLRCKLIWIEGAYLYRNPNDDLPADWETNREAYYLQLGLPLKAADFVKKLKDELHLNLQNLNDTLPYNNKVKILDKKKGGHIRITPSAAQAEPPFLDALQREINRRWSTINLIDIVKEADLRINFTKQFHSLLNG